MVDGSSVRLTVGDLVRLTGMPKRTIQRRCDAWLAGVRTPYAIKCTREYGTTGRRLIDSRDAERVRRQHSGEMSATVTADEYALDTLPNRGDG